MFEIADSKTESARLALDIRSTIIGAYENARTVRDMLANYGGDPTYTAAVDLLFDAPERIALGVVAQLFSDLVTTLEAQHAAVLRPPAPVP